MKVRLHICSTAPVAECQCPAQEVEVPDGTAQVVVIGGLGMGLPPGEYVFKVEWWLGHFPNGFNLDRRADNPWTFDGREDHGQPKFHGPIQEFRLARFDFAGRIGG